MSISPALPQACRRATLLGAGSAVAIGAVCLLGYLLGVRQLAGALPGWPPIAPITALAWAAAGISLWLLATPGVGRRRRVAGRGVAVAVGAVAIAVLVERVTGWDLALDRLLFAGTARAWHPGGPVGRPSAEVAIALLGTAVALCLLDADAKAGYRPSQLLAPFAASVTGVALVGHLVGQASASGGSGICRISAPTALVTVALSVGIFTSRPDGVAVRAFAGTGLGAATIRRLAPAVAAVVVLVGVVAGVLARSGRPADGLGATIAISALTMTLYLVLLRTGYMLDGANRAQRELNTDLRHQRDFSNMVLRSLNEGVVVLAGDGTVLQVNSRWSEITGFAAEDAVGLRPPYPWWPAELIGDRTQKLRSGLAAAENTEFDLALRRADGSSVRVLVAVCPIRDQDGRLLRSILTYRDMTDYNRAQAEQRQLADELDHFFTMSHDLMCIASPDGMFLRLNDAWQRTLGHPDAELLNQPFVRFVHPDDVARTIAETRKVADGVPTVAFENRYRCHDGSYRWLSWNATPAPQQGRVYAVARDITVQREIYDARTSLAAIVDGTADAIIAKTLDGTITSWNPAAERIYGYRAEEVVGRSISIIFPPDSGGQLSEVLARIAAGETVKVDDSIRIRKDGAVVHLALTISPLRDMEGVVVGAASIAHDITDTKKAEERFRRLVFSAPDAMVIATADGVIRLVNEQTERLFGYAGDELIGQPIEVLVPPELRERHIGHRLGFLAHPEIRGMGAGLEMFGVRADGTRFPIEVRLAPLDTEEGTLISAAVRDITERREVEQDLAAARDEALAAAQLKSQFVAMVSHEIRTPMNGVIGLTKLLLDTPLQPTQRRYGEAIRTSARALLTIINDILDFSKMEAGKVALLNADFDLGKLVEEVAHAAAEAARDKNLEIVNYYPADLPRTVRGDEGRIRQVLLNLLGNAVKFTHDGEILIRVDTAPPASAGRREFTFTVIDTGVGIAPEYLSRLFEPFVQADGTNSREYGGTGLGLTISHQLVELMTGRLEAESEVGRGSRFFFTIPLEVPAASAEQSTAQDTLVGRTLLIVDDSVTSCHLLAEHARAWGMVTTTAFDARSGLDRLRDAAQGDRPFDIAVIDQHMPEEDGLTLVNWIAGDPSVPSPLTILLTSGSYQDDQHVEALDGVTILAKPVGPSALYNCLIEHLDPSGAKFRLAALAGIVPRGGERGIVLLAEDNEINRMVAIDTLAGLGYQADVANNGLEALELAPTKPYKAILMDCQMPKMDGYQATREIRRGEPADHHIPVIAMTAGALAEDRQRCLDAGMDDYLAKPIDPDELQAKLDHWAGVPAAGDPR